jgi:hypothetical protein
MHWVHGDHVDDLDQLRGHFTAEVPDAGNDHRVYVDVANNVQQTAQGAVGISENNRLRKLVTEPLGDTAYLNLVPGL